MSLDLCLIIMISPIQFSSVAQSCATLYDPMDCSMSGFPVHHQFPEPAQTHVHRVGDTMQPSHPLHPLLLLSSIFPSIRVFSSESVFVSGRQSTGASASASVLPMNTQDWFPLGLTSLISLQSKGLSRVFSNTVQKHQFFGTQLSLWTNSHINTWLCTEYFICLKNPLCSAYSSPFLPNSKPLENTDLNILLSLYFCLNQNVT